MELRASTCSAIRSHFPSQPSTHALPSSLYRISTLVNFERAKSTSAFFSSQPTLRASFTVFAPFFAMNSAMQISLALALLVVCKRYKLQVRFDSLFYRQLRDVKYTQSFPLAPVTGVPIPPRSG